MSIPRELERRFLRTMCDWILSLPHDLKVLFEAKDDPNLERAARETAAGAILYVLNPDKLKVMGEENFVGFADDSIVLHEALRAIVAQGGEGAPPFRERFAEHFATLDEDLAVLRDAIGESYAWMAAKVPLLNRQTYKGKKVDQYLDDDESVELLYEDSLAFGTDYPIDEDKLGMRLKRPETLLEPLRRRATEERKRIA